jgi:anti-anti-sigma regulatory factor
MGSSGHIITMWTCRREVHLSVQGTAGDDLLEALDHELQHVLAAGATHLVVSLHGLGGTDAEILELLAATCHRLWRVEGIMEIVGIRDRLVSSPEVVTLPEVFGDLTDVGTRPPALR